MSFSKAVIVAFTIACFVWISASFALAFMDKNSNEMITSAIVSGLAVTLIGYCWKSCKENLNKYSKGADGVSKPVTKRPTKRAASKQAEDVLSDKERLFSMFKEFLDKNGGDHND
jgi:hypothetical protein